jgi:selenide, water dikinase
MHKRLTDFASCSGCAGKISPQGISQLLGSIPKLVNDRVLVGTETHDDAGVYRLTDEIALVQTLDFFPPVVDDPFVYGQIAAANALSDVYAMGGEPKTVLNLVGYPDDELGDFDWLTRILQGGADRCQLAGAVILGGHTVRDSEIKFGLSVTGVVHPDEFWTNSRARPGDKLVLTKPLGTGFVTTAARKQVCPAEVLEAGCASMIQLNRIGRDAIRATSGVSAVTDVTGFGLCGHAFEMAEGSGVTLRIDVDSLPLLPGILEHQLTRFRTRASRTNFDYVKPLTKLDDRIDPQRAEFLWDAQTSGGLLIAVPEDRVETLLRELQARNALAAVVIGEVLPREEVALIFASARP